MLYQKDAENRVHLTIEPEEVESLIHVGQDAYRHCMDQVRRAADLLSKDLDADELAELITWWYNRAKAAAYLYQDLTMTITDKPCDDLPA